MRLQISLAAMSLKAMKAETARLIKKNGPISRLPPLATFLSKESIRLLEKWHEIGGKSSALFSVKNFEKVREEFQAAGLWNPPIGGYLYRGMNLTVKQFVDFMREGMLSTDSSVTSWTTMLPIATGYAEGLTSGNYAFGVVFKTPVSSGSKILADLRQSQAQIQGGSSGESEVVLRGFPLSSTSIEKILVPVKNKKRMVEVMKALTTLQSEDLFVGTPDANTSEYHVDVIGRITK